MRFSKSSDDLKMYDNDNSLTYIHMGRCMMISLSFSPPLKEDIFIIPIIQIRKQKLRVEFKVASKEVTD